MLGVFGEPLHIRLRNGTTAVGTFFLQRTPKQVAVLINGAPALVPLRACRAWACPTCTSTKVWWRPGEAAVCARCVRMPREVYLQLWEDARAHALTVALNTGEHGEDYRPYVVAVVEQAVANGDLSTLLKFATCRYLLRLAAGSEGVGA